MILSVIDNIRYYDATVVFPPYRSVTPQRTRPAGGSLGRVLCSQYTSKCRVLLFTAKSLETATR